MAEGSVFSMAGGHALCEVHMPYGVYEARFPLHLLALSHPHMTILVCLKGNFSEWTVNGDLFLVSCDLMPLSLSLLVLY